MKKTLVFIVSLLFIPIIANAEISSNDVKPYITCSVTPTSSAGAIYAKPGDTISVTVYGYSRSRIDNIDQLRYRLSYEDIIYNGNSVINKNNTSHLLDRSENRVLFEPNVTFTIDKMELLYFSFSTKNSFSSDSDPGYINISGRDIYRELVDEHYVDLNGVCEYNVYYDFGTTGPSVEVASANNQNTTLNITSLVPDSNTGDINRNCYVKLNGDLVSTISNCVGVKTYTTTGLTVGETYTFKVSIDGGGTTTKNVTISQAHEYKEYDWNDDGTFDIKDVILYRKYLAGAEQKINNKSYADFEEAHKRALNADNDLIISLADLVNARINVKE